MDVPEMLFCASSAVCHAEVMAEPGAKRSRQEPLLL